MNACRASLATCLAALLGGCASRPPAPAELDPLEPGRAARAVLPDELERAASRGLALAFADRADHAALTAGLTRDAENQRRAAGQPPGGLADWVADAAVAAGGLPAYLPHAARQVKRRDLDPVLRLRMENLLADQPLAVAERSLADERRSHRARIFNRVSAPLARLVLGGGVNLIETGRAALRSLLLLHHFPQSSARERRALRAYRDFLAHHPQDPRAPQVKEQAEALARRLAHERAETALDAARSALGAGRMPAARSYLTRAERIRHDMPELEELRENVAARGEAHDAALRHAFGAEPAPSEPSNGARTALAAAVLAAPADELARRTAEAARTGVIHSDERHFLESLALRGPGQDAAFFEKLDAVIEQPGPNPMARHAASVRSDPAQNPYRFYRGALRQQRTQLGRWLLLGPLASRPSERQLPWPLEILVDGLSLPFALLTTPLRLLQLPAAQHAGSPSILRAGERYIARFPEGAHAAELRRELENRSAAAGLYLRALEHSQARGGSARRARRYREQLAAGLLEAAPRERRPDMRAALYAELLRNYSDTRSAERARTELAELLRTSSVQQIRLSHAFLREHLELCAPEALALRPELLDGVSRNGEMAEEGLTLVGGRWVRVSLEGREAVLQRVPAANLARLAALLDETTYRTLAGDARERAEPDPQRDAFLESARLELLERPDPRPTARSQAEYLGTHERHGWLRERRSILPFELVLQGDLESLGLGAAPRLRLPEPRADDFLYE